MVSSAHPSTAASRTRGTAAREAMLDAAEQIACESGLGAITLTAVQQRAGQSNKSAAAYHFGNLDGLLSAMLGRHMHTVDARRWELLEQIPDTDPAAVLDQVVEAMVLPLAEATVLRPGGDSRYARVAAQSFIHPSLSVLAQGHGDGSSLREVQRLVGLALSPTLGEEIARLRYSAAIAMVVTTLALYEGHPVAHDTSELVQELVRTARAVLRAVP